MANCKILNFEKIYNTNNDNKNTEKAYIEFLDKLMYDTI